MQQQQNAAASSRIKLSEIFTSIEGEGVLFGTKTMFIRMAGCPLKCHWCDTSYAIPMNSGNDYSIDEAKELISQSLQPNTYKVNFTGGEPLVQYDAIVKLAKFIKQKGIRTYLESACYDSSKFLKVLPFIDICKIEFKLRDSKVVDEKYYDNILKNEMECLKLAISNDKTSYIKIIVTNSSNLKEFTELVQEIFRVTKPSDIAGFIIQPSYRIDEPTLEFLFGFYDAVYPLYDQVRIVPQLHKTIGVR